MGLMACPMTTPRLCSGSQTSEQTIELWRVLWERSTGISRQPYRGPRTPPQSSWPSFSKWACQAFSDKDSFTSFWQPYNTLHLAPCLLGPDGPRLDVDPFCNLGLLSPIVLPAHRDGCQ